MNPIPQADLEATVIEAVLDFYKPYLAKDGRRKLGKAVKEQLGSEGEHYDAARTRAEEEQQRINGIINNLLDNITSTNREHVDHRLNELTNQRRELETRLEELDLLATSQAQVTAITTDAMRFLAGLDFTLHQGLPQEELVALRQCLTRIHINKPTNEIKLTLRKIPTANLDATHESIIRLARPSTPTTT